MSKQDERRKTLLDWPRLMRFALGELRLQPADFWALTPHELILMLGKDPSKTPMTSDRLSALMASFPDSDPLPPVTSN